MKFPFPATIKGLKTARKRKIDQNLQEAQKEGDIFRWWVLGSTAAVKGGK